MGVAHAVGAEEGEGHLALGEAVPGEKHALDGAFAQQAHHLVAACDEGAGREVEHGPQGITLVGCVDEVVAGEYREGAP